MGLINLLLETNPEQFKYYSGGTGGKGYTGGGTSPGMKSANDFYLINENGKPLITFDINNGNPDVPGSLISNLQTLGNLGDELTSSDFILRGGLQAPLRSALDVERLKRWKNNPSNADGLIFSVKQNVLSRINPKTEATFGFGYAPGGAFNAGLYTTSNTFAQAGLNAFGIHLNKQGVLDTDLSFSTDSSILGINRYEDVINTQNVENFDKKRDAENKGGNKLVLLKNAIDGNVSTNLNFSSLNRYFFNDGDGTNVISYGGGPGAEFGFGKTNIRFASERTGKQNNKLLNTNFYNVTADAGGIDVFGFLTNPTAETEDRPQRGNFSVFKRPEIKYSGNNIFNGKGVTMLYSTLTEVDLQLDKYGTSPNSSNLRDFETSVYTPTEAGTFPENTDRIGKGSWKQKDFIDQDKTEDNEILDDFRKKLDPTGTPQNTFLSLAPNYKDQNIEKRVNLGDPGKKGDISNYQKGKRDITGFARGPLDTITAFPIYRSNNVTSNFKEKNDLVKFRIAIIDPESPSKKTFIHFRAFLNGFSDGYQGNWKGQKYMGRAEELYKYDGFSRDISVSFTVAAQSKEELYPMYRKLNFLASSLAPTYTKAGYMAGNLSKMTVGGYLYEQPGFISSIDYDVPQESPWEIGIPSTEKANSVGNQGFEDSSLKEMPHIINVSLKFTPIHKFRPSINTITTPNDDASGLKDNNTYGNQRFIAIADGSGLNYNGYDVKPTNDAGTTEETIEEENTTIDTTTPSLDNPFIQDNGLNSSALPVGTISLNNSSDTSNYSTGGSTLGNPFSQNSGLG